MEYNEFEKIVITGHNIEFEYGNEKYLILKDSDAYHFVEIDNQNYLMKYNNIFQLLVDVKIKGNSIKDISKDMQNIQVY